MRVLVTGIAGCLGQYVAKTLAQQGFEVIGSYRTRKPKIVPELNIRLICNDLHDVSTLPDNYDAVFHAAASSPAGGISATDMVVNNIEATRKLLRHSRNVGAKHFVFCSSISVYGNVAGSEVDERTSICDPDSYGLTKRIGEILVAEASSAFSSLSLRLPAVVGPGATRNILAQTAAKLRLNEPVSIFNPDAEYNNAVHCADVAAFVSKLLTNSWHGHAVLVLGSGGTMKIRAAIERLRDKLGSSSPITTIDPPKNPFLLNISRAVKSFGFAPMQIDAVIDQFAVDVALQS